MSVSIRPMPGAFCGLVESLDPGALDDGDRRRLRRGLLDHGVLVARGLALSPAEHVELTRVFGEPDIHPIESIRLEGTPEIIDLHAPPDTTDPDAAEGDEVVGRIEWHSDLTYTAEPSRGALLHAVEVPPEGGQTGFVDTAAAHDALPADLRARIEGLHLVHGFGMRLERRVQQGTGSGDDLAFPDVTHPLVHRHPESGRWALNISPVFAREIVELPGDEGDRLLRELLQLATQDRFTYFHDWRVDDLVVWDNWRTMHTALGHPRRYGRRMHRTTIRGGPLAAVA